MNSRPDVLYRPGLIAECYSQRRLDNEIHHLWKSFAGGVPKFDIRADGSCVFDAFHRHTMIHLALVPK